MKETESIKKKRTYFALFLIEITVIGAGKVVGNGVEDQLQVRAR